MYSTRFSPRCRDAFTLIELLVVIVVIGILVGIALPVFNQLTVKSRQTQTLSNMRQVGAAFLLYAGDNNGTLPGRFTTSTKWPALLLPYVQNVNVYNSPIPGYVGTKFQVTDPSQVTSSIQNNTDYIANGYNDLGAYANQSILPRLSMIPTPTQVILLGIQYPGANNFYMDFAEGNEQTQNHVLDKTPSPWLGSVYVFCDGSARFLVDYPPGDTLAGATTAPPSGGFYTDWLWLMIKTNATQ